MNFVLALNAALAVDVVYVTDCVVFAGSEATGTVRPALSTTKSVYSEILHVAANDGTAKSSAINKIGQASIFFIVHLPLVMAAMYLTAQPMADT